MSKRNSEDKRNQEEVHKKRAKLWRKDQVAAAAKTSRWSIPSGTILSVHLKNFMCHSDYTYKPIERVNFLNGENGSGKSAVLTAIVFCLGGTAKLSNRGKTNKTLVKTGSHLAAVQITLHNGGSNPYKPDLFGDAIVVSRSITSSGKSSYKLKDASLRLVKISKAREEVEQMLLCFGIQVDNPIVILNQDAAKTFLHKSDPEKLYLFFMRATHLSACKELYNDSYEAKVRAETMLQEKVRNLHKLKEESLKWKKKFEFLQTLQQDKHRIDRLKAELAWAMVEAMRANVDRKQRDVDSLQQEISQIDEQAHGYAEKKEKKLQKKEELEADIRSWREAIEKQKALVNTLRETKAAASNELCKSAQRSMNECSQELRSRKEQLTSLTSQMSEVMKRQQGPDPVEEKKARICQLEEEKQALEANIASTRTHLTNLHHTLSTVREQDFELKAHLAEVDTKLRRRQHDLDALKHQVGNRLAVYGESFPAFKAEIDREAKTFQVKPIGPLGVYVKTRPDVSADEAELIESHLGQILTAFLVNSSADRLRLAEIARRYNINVPIITFKLSSKMFDVSSSRCQSDRHPTILDRLMIENPDVANCLIDYKNVERILLVKTDKEAQELLKDQHTVPKNCLFALTFDHNQFYPYPHYRSYALSIVTNNSPKLRCNVDDLKLKIGRDVKQLESQQTDIRSQIDKLQVKRKVHQSEEDRLQKSMTKLITDAKRLGMELAKLQVQEVTYSPPDLVVLQDEIERAQEKIDESQAKFAEAAEKYQQQQQVAKGLLSDVLKQEEELQAKIVSYKQVVEMMSELNDKLAQDRNKMASLETKKKDLHKIVLERSKLVADIKTQLQDIILKAKGWSEEEIKTERKPEEIKAEIKHLQNVLLTQTKSSESEETIISEYKRSTVLYTNVKQKVMSLKANLQNLEDMLKIRKKGFITIRSSMCRAVQMSFLMRLQERKFYGELIFNHKENSLTIVVNPDMSGSGATRDLKTLSGGEKSYATISFILSLWDLMNPPFRCLDEFDVFMDSVNRRTAIEQIIRYAREIRKSQFIFLTPLSVESVKETEDVQIVRIFKD